ncbi:hypothetical protein AUR66_08470 [Haloferax profundi]|uniref:Uncharacterized protein n=1 Tax=Haloferax profundi TaxID=1544718 RepID=A0A0W1SV51_9EURY|nr:hypothetical protein AUR66_08470 [Haloferax profundi]
MSVDGSRVHTYIEAALWHNSKQNDIFVRSRTETSFGTGGNSSSLENELASELIAENDSGLPLALPRRYMFSLEQLEVTV